MPCKKCRLPDLFWKNIHTLQKTKKCASVHPLLRTCPRLQNTFEKKKFFFCSYVHCHNIHNSQDLETLILPKTGDYLKKSWYIYTMKHYLAKRKKNHTICHSMDGTKGEHTKWSQPEGKRQTQNDLLHIWDIKMQSRGITNGQINRMRHSSSHIFASWILFGCSYLSTTYFFFLNK